MSDVYNLQELLSFPSPACGVRNKRHRQRELQFHELVELAGRQAQKPGNFPQFLHAYLQVFTEQLQIELVVAHERRQHQNVTNGFISHRIRSGPK